MLQSLAATKYSRGFIFLFFCCLVLKRNSEFGRKTLKSFQLSTLTVPGAKLLLPLDNKEGFKEKRER